jgi:uncharacterized protein YhaN
MRLTTLEFNKVGLWRQPFSLALAPRVTLVLGDNEAGKSTMRRAIDALLFGPDKERVAPQSVGAFDFGALADADDGTAVRLHRRGRNLVTPPPSPLQQLLAPDLAGRFRDLFCLSHENLRADDAEFLGADGAIGSLLFGASAGMAPGRLTRMLDSLNDQIKKARSRARNQDGLGSRLEVYAGCWQQHKNVARFEEYREAAQLEENAKAEEERGALKLRELRQEQALLKQLLNGVSTFESLESARHELARLTGVRQPLTPAQVIELRERWGQLAECAADLARRRREHDEVTQMLDALQEPGPLVELAADMEALRDTVARVDADRRDVVTEADAHRAQLRELQRLLESLGADGGNDLITAAAALLIPIPVRSVLQQLVDRHDALAAQRSDREASLAESARRFKTASEKAAQAAQTDLSAFERAKTHAEAAAKQESEISGLTTAQRKLEAEVEQLARQLGFADSVDAAQRCPIPPDRDRALEAARSLAIARQEAEKAQGVVERARQDHAAQRDRCESLQARLGELPTADRIRQSKALRDAKWLELQSYWTPEFRTGTEAALARTATEFEALMELVDAQVAQRAAAGELLGQWQSAEANLAVATRSLSEATEKRDIVVAAASATHDSWSALWPFLSAPPATPADWFTRYERWHELAGERRDLHARIADERTLLQQAKASALAQVRTLMPSLSESLAASEIVDEIRAEERRRISANQAASKLQGAVQQAQDALQESRDKLDQTAIDEATWKREWDLRCVILPAGIPPSPAGVRAWLAGQTGLERTRQALEESAIKIEERRQRISDLDQRIVALVSRARSLDADLSVPPTLDPRSAFDALLVLTTRARERQHAREAALGKRATSGRELTRVESRRTVLADHLNGYWTELNQAEELSEAAVSRAVELAEQAERLQQQINTLDARLDGLWQEQRTTFQARLASEGQSALSDRLGALETALADTELALKDKRQAHHEAVSALRQLDDSHDLLQVEQAYTEAREAVLERADELHQLLLAKYLLEQAYAQASEGASHLEARASGYFKTLTADSYSGLRIDRTEDGTSRLTAIHRNGDELTLGQLSSGTRDQIWLALRLAAIVEAARETPFPLILDDVFVHFDDERSTAALRLLADVAEHVQVIAFTHHDHIVDLAKAAIPEEQLSLITLPRPDTNARVRTLSNRRTRQERPQMAVGDDAEDVSPPGDYEQGGDDQPDESNMLRRLTDEAAERVILELLRAAATPQSKSELIEAAEQMEMDLGPAWTAAIKALVATESVAREGTTRSARYRLPG